MPRSEPRRWGAIAGLTLALSGISALLVEYASDLHAMAVVRQLRSSDFLLKGDTPMIGTPPSRGAIERAIEADPLNQTTFNTAMMQLGRSGGAMPSPAWFATLARYGWRSTPALQNLIYYYALHEQVGAALDVADALFRREKQTQQASAIFSLAETDPSLRSSVVRRLRLRPAWRHPFLLASNVLTDPAAIEGRYETLRALQRSGDPLPEEEMTALLPVLVSTGRTSDAFTLWSYRRKGIERPLNDPQFVQAAAGINQDDTATPFKWRFLSGDNFDVTTGGRGSSGIVIHWNGQGLPVFAMQQTSASPGTYRMRVAFNEEDGAMAKALGYRMICGDTRVDFDYVSAPDTTHGDWKTARPVLCAFPRLEIFGALADKRQDVTVNLNGIVLQRVDPRAGT